MNPALRIFVELLAVCALGISFGLLYLFVGWLMKTSVPDEPKPDAELERLYRKLAEWETYAAEAERRGMQKCAAAGRRAVAHYELKIAVREQLLDHQKRV